MSTSSNAGDNVVQRHLLDQDGVQSPTGSAGALLQSAALSELRSKIGESKAVEGFPIGSESNIAEISMPPYYAACPSPFLPDWFSPPATLMTSSLQPTPLTEDISVGKSDPLYFAHYYSTKVPPQAIVPYILNFTQPGEIVLDGFCGTGMTGVAAQLCAESGHGWERYGRLGARRAVMIDLSPAATFIAAITNAIGQFVPFLGEYEEIVNSVAKSHQHILRTLHVGWPRGETLPSRRVNGLVTYATEYGHIEYTVWSDVFVCSECASELIYWDLVFQGPGQPLREPLICPTCGAQLSIRTLKHAWVETFDDVEQKTVRNAKQVPVLINYRVGSKRFEKIPDDSDLQVLLALAEKPLPYPVPLVEMPNGFNTAQPRLSHGLTHVHHFYSRRNLVLLGDLWTQFQNLENPLERLGGIYLLTGMTQRICRMNRYMPTHDRHVGPLSGTLYVPQLTAEIPATNYALDRIEDLRRCAAGPKGTGVRVSTQSATDLRNIPSDSVDYIFTDPPFGGNLNYSELNILVEAWLQVRTATHAEAIVNETQRKGLAEYQHLMAQSFIEFHRVLREGHWMTVEFHNSQNSVWAAIQQALWDAGFVVADIRTLDKQKGTTKQLSYGAAVKQDLVISAYKPNGGLEDRFQVEAGKVDGVWDFVRTHLRQLPVFVTAKDGRAEVIAERLDYLLFDRMVAFHVQRGVAVPLSAPEFYAGLRQNFPERDDMFFLAEQVAEYERKRMSAREIQQLTIFVTNEATAIQWLRQRLANKPQTQAELTPEFMRELGGWAKHEELPEMIELLEQNFLRYDGDGPIPAQIVSWMKKSADLRELLAPLPAREDGGVETSSARLIAAARDRWYVPDPNKAIDLEKLRTRALLKEFQTYTEGRGRLKIFRTEAVRAGFANAWRERDYATITRVAGRLPEAVLQEDPDLLMYYDNAMLRTE